MPSSGDPDKARDKATFLKHRYHRASIDTTLTQPLYRDLPISGESRASAMLQPLAVNME